MRQEMFALTAPNELDGVCGVRLRRCLPVRASSLPKSFVCVRRGRGNSRR